MPSSTQNPRSGRFRRVAGGIVILGVVAVAGSIATGHYFHAAQATAATAAPEPAVPVTVAVIQPRPTTLFDDFSGRLEAVDRVQLRPRVAGAILSTNFTEGALVKSGDILFKIDPAPYAAEVDRAEAQVEAAKARVVFTSSESRARRATGRTHATSSPSVTFDQRDNAYREADRQRQVRRKPRCKRPSSISHYTASPRAGRRTGRPARGHGRQPGRSRDPSSPVLTNAGLGQSDLCELRRR
jgi:multidrug efflux system membrane fusion protein